MIRLKGGSVGRILSDREIKELCEKDPPMITPFVPRQEGKPSYGLSSFGYDIRLGKRFLVPLGGVNVVLDPLNFPKDNFREVIAEDHFDIAPHTQVLAESVEWFNMPDDVMGLCFGKSTYARAGLLVNATPLECFDDQTEILTLNGWKRFEDLEENEVVATLTPDGFLEYRPIIARQKRWYEGDMIAIKGQSIDLLVTPDHHLYVRGQKRTDFELLPAKDIEGYKGIELKKDAVWVGQEPESFTLAPLSRYGQERMRAVALQVFDVLEDLQLATAPEIYKRIDSSMMSMDRFRRLLTILTNLGALERRRVHIADGRSTGTSHFWQYRLKKRLDDFGLYEPIEIPMDAWVEFLGLWMAKGSAFVTNKRNAYVVTVAQMKPRTVPRVKEILGRLPFKWKRDSWGFRVSNRQLGTYLAQFGHQSEKFIPEEIKALSPRLLRQFLKGYMLGDGEFKRAMAYTNSRRLADDLQEIGLKIGWPATCAVKRETGAPVAINPQYRTRHTIYRVSFTQYKTPRVPGKGGWSRVPYKGYVYDVTVPPNHTIYVRRNGKAVWSGNCGWSGKLTLELANLSPLPIRLHIGQGIAQIVFFRGKRPQRTYAEKEAGGIYQNQQGVTLPRC